MICFANGCMSDYEVTPEMLANMKKGQNLVVQAINANGAPLTLPLPLQETGGSGFAKAYDGPPTDPKVFEENQKKLQEELQKRAEEARKKLEATQGAGAPAAKQLRPLDHGRIWRPTGRLFCSAVIASEAKQSIGGQPQAGLLRRFAPRNDGKYCFD